MVTSVQSATSNINASSTSLGNNYEMFLNLLTTQLKNQDPLNPMDNNQFTTQLTQMTGVQQQLLTNQLLTQMMGQGQANLASGAISMIGKQVTVVSDDAPLEGGKATWNYNLAAGATAAKLEVLDANGNVVATNTPTDFAKGAHTFTWDGKASNGKTLDDGVYSLKITATDDAGKAVAASSLYTGIATGVANVNGETLLSVGKITAALTAVTGISQAPTS
jgi:flagellar basal-body rod modification protein FlgD